MFKILVKDKTFSLLYIKLTDRFEEEREKKKDKRINCFFVRTSIEIY